MIDDQIHLEGERSEFRAIDLFSGCGGLTTGLKAAGFRVIAAVECAKGEISAYRLNHPDVPHIYSMDICGLSGEQILRDTQLKRGELELLAGCPPCQGFSRMRTRNRRQAALDTRNDLIHEYARLVRELLPRALLMENVPGLLHDFRYESLLDTIRELGYHYVDEIHDAAKFGVPQRRRRLIMLAAREVKISMPKPDNDNDYPVRAVLEGLPTPGDSLDPVHNVLETRTSHVQNLISRIPHDGGSRRDLDTGYQLKCHRNFVGFHDVYGRMCWDEVSPTITSGFPNPSKGRFLHPTQNRCITPREAALLQTFPPDYQFPMELGKFPVARMIGNAFPPELARRHALAVFDALTRTHAAQPGMTDETLPT